MKKTKKILAVICALAMCIGFTSMTISAARVYGDSFEGWRRVSKDVTSPDSAITQDSETKALTIDTLVNGGNAIEQLFLNRDLGDGNDSGDENIAKFGRTNMTNFEVEYDMQVQEIAAGGGSFEFAFMNEFANADLGNDLSMGSITAATGDSHTIFWNRGSYWRNGWVNLPGGGWGDLGGYYNTRLDGDPAAVHHMKITKNGLTITMQLDSRDVFTTTLPNDKQLPESGYMGFYAWGIKVVLSNVKVTNGSTGDSVVFFEKPEPEPEPEPDPAPNQYEGWAHFSKDAAIEGNYVSYNETTHAFSFNTVDSGSQEMIYLNRDIGDGKDSSEGNIAKFGKNDMSDFVCEYDIEITGTGSDGGMIEFAFMNQRAVGDDFMSGSITGGNTDAHTIFWCRGSFWVGDSWKDLKGGGWGDLGGYYHEVITGTGTHHMRITKKGWNLSIAMDDKAPVKINIPESAGLPSSGYMGFYAKGADGTVSNVVIKNVTSGEAAAYFTDPADPVDPGSVIDPEDPNAGTEEGEFNQYEGWAHLSLGADTPGQYVHYDEDTREISFNTIGTSSKEMLFLNRDIGDGKDSSEENVSKFGKNNMSDFVCEYDINLKETGANGGMIEFAFMNARSVSDDLMNGSITGGNTDSHTLLWCRGAYWIDDSWKNLEGGGYGDLGGYYFKAIAGSGLHRMKIVKEGWTVSIGFDDEVPVEVDLPSDFGLPESGYMGFYAMNCTATISDVVITNSTTGEKGIFFGDGISNVSDEDFSDFWETSDDSDIRGIDETGVRVQNTGKYPDNTSLKYRLPLDLTNLTWEFVPQLISTVEDDPDAWMGFALTNNDKTFNINVPTKSSGVVAEIRTHNDGSAEITFKSLLPGEEYGTHTATHAIPVFKAGVTYTFGTKANENGGIDIYLDGEKIASLDWLKGVYHDNLIYFTTTASGSNGAAQIWTIMKINGENACNYDSGLVDYGPSEPGQDDPEQDDEQNKDTSPATGSADYIVIFFVAAILSASAVTVVLADKRKSHRT